MKACTNKMA